MGGDLADVRLWAGELERLHGRLVHRFSRSEPRVSALAHMRGLVAPLERKNGWTLAEQAVHGGADRIHRLLNRIDWNDDEVLGEVRDWVTPMQYWRTNSTMRQLVAHQATFALPTPA